MAIISGGYSKSNWRTSNPPQTKLREYYELGLRTANLTYQLSNQFGGGMLDSTVPLTVEGKWIVGQMQRRGYTPDETAKILGGNWMRVFREAWNA